MKNNRSTQRILIISKENSKENTVFPISTLAKKLGLVVEGIAHNYQQALNFFKKSPPHLIICDAADKRWDGIVIIKKISAHYLVPVILIAEEANALLLEKAKGANLVGFVTTPIPLRQLEINIELALSN